MLLPLRRVHRDTSEAVQDAQRESARALQPGRHDSQLPLTQTPDMAQPTSEQIASWAERKTRKPAHQPAYKRLTDDQRMAILRLHKLDKTQTEIAVALGIDQSTVCRWLNQCQDTTLDASAFLRGQALRMARNIVKKGRAADHIKTLEGINVLQAQENTGVTVIVGGSGQVNIGIALSPSQVGRQSESLKIPE